MNKQIVVGFPIELENNINYKELNDRKLHELALDSEDAVIYDCVKDFFNELNDDFVDTENMYWFVINIH